MQSGPGGGGTSCGGGGGGGLARFRSAPATWLDALLEDDEEDPLKHNHSLTELLAEEDDIGSAQPGARSSGTFAADEPAVFDGSGPGIGFLRQNSSPAELRGVGSDGYFQSYAGSGNYGYLSTSAASAELVHGIKRHREEETQKSSKRFSSQSLEREQSVQSTGAMAALLDMDMDRGFEEPAPSKIRAKRGCATHPRSIAERIRRTRISDRIRKLQELLPNMDKTNTADMLDEAVEYVKHLQKQIQELSEHQRKCTCLVKD